MLSRVPRESSFLALSMLAALLAIWLQCVIFGLLLDGRWASTGDLPLQLTLLATTGVALFAWITLHARGLVGPGSGAGFRLAIVGLAARVEVSMFVLWMGGETGASIDDAVPAAAGAIRWVRTGSLVAFGWGLGLVAVACAFDLRRARRVPQWLRSPL